MLDGLSEGIVAVDNEGRVTAHAIPRWSGCSTPAEDHAASAATRA